MRVWPGSPLPLGATWDGEGVNFAPVQRARAKASSSCCSTRRPRTALRPRSA